jgi:hypothetical protein
MPAGVIERVFGTKMGPEIVNFGGGSGPEKRHETTVVADSGLDAKSLCPRSRR